MEKVRVSSGAAGTRGLWAREVVEYLAPDLTEWCILSERLLSDMERLECRVAPRSSYPVRFDRPRYLTEWMPLLAPIFGGKALSSSFKLSLRPMHAKKRGSEGSGKPVRCVLGLVCTVAAGVVFELAPPPAALVLTSIASDGG